MLVSGNPQDSRNIKRMIFKEGNQPAMEMPVGMGMMMTSPPAGETAAKMINKGQEMIKVPAGMFKAQHVQYQDKEGTIDVWVYKGVAPYGVIKSQAKDMEMVLLSYGTGAKSLITETPHKMEMPQIPERRPKRR